MRARSRVACEGSILSDIFLEDMFRPQFQAELPTFIYFEKGYSTFVILKSYMPKKNNIKWSANNAYQNSNKIACSL